MSRQVLPLPLDAAERASLEEAMFATTDARTSLLRAQHELARLYAAGLEYGPWMLAVQESMSGLAVTEAEMGDELRRSDDARDHHV